MVYAVLGGRREAEGLSFCFVLTRLQMQYQNAGLCFRQVGLGASPGSQGWRVNPENVQTISGAPDGRTGLRQELSVDDDAGVSIYHIRSL